MQPEPVSYDVATVKTRAAWMRRRAMQMVHRKGLGHIGGDLSATDIVAALYFGTLRYNPADPDWPERDRFVMSKGHASGVLYTALCAAGYFPDSWLDTYMAPNSKLNGHPNRKYVPGVEANTGPLGHGFPIAVGIAIAGELSAQSYRTYVLTGDGEQQEGSNWEAAMTAGARSLSRLTLIVDRNYLQQGARTEETVALDPLDKKYAAFGWDVITVDGHNHDQLLDVLNAESSNGKPRCVIANTTKGKGVSFMEDQAKWHHGVPNDEEFELAISELSG